MIETDTLTYVKNMLKLEENEYLLEALSVLFYDDRTEITSHKELDVRGTIIEEMINSSLRFIKEKGCCPPSKVDKINCYEVTNFTESRATPLRENAKSVLFSSVLELAGKGPVFTIEEDGVVVSLASACINGNFAEIQIETAPSYRKKGYAKECLSALTKHLLGMGITPLYFVREENEASMKTVATLRPKLVASYIKIVGRK